MLDPSHQYFQLGRSVTIFHTTSRGYRELPFLLACGAPPDQDFVGVELRPIPEILQFRIGASPTSLWQNTPFSGREKMRRSHRRAG